LPIVVADVADAMRDAQGGLHSAPVGCATDRGQGASLQADAAAALPIAARRLRKCRMSQSGQCDRPEQGAKTMHRRLRVVGDAENGATGLKVPPRYR
jgi:hypothetical protein